MENKKNEKLQSRREFFKKAAKVALPVVGAVVLSSLPIAEAKASGCNNNCVYTCGGGCQGTCQNMCALSCGNSCQNTCQHHCTAMQAGY